MAAELAELGGQGGATRIGAVPEERWIQPLDSRVCPWVTTQNSEAWQTVGKFREQIRAGRIKMPEKHPWP